jgi:hypothetical protein
MILMVNSNSDKKSAAAKEVVFTAKVQSRGEDDRISIEVPTRFRKLVKSWEYPWVVISRDMPKGAK